MQALTPKAINSSPDNILNSRQVTKARPHGSLKGSKQGIGCGEIDPICPKVIDLANRSTLDIKKLTRGRLKASMQADRHSWRRTSRFGAR